MDIRPGFRLFAPIFAYPPRFSPIRPDFRPIRPGFRLSAPIFALSAPIFAYSPRFSPIRPDFRPIRPDFRLSAPIFAYPPRFSPYPPRFSPIRPDFRLSAPIFAYPPRFSPYPPRFSPYPPRFLYRRLRVNAVRFRPVVILLSDHSPRGRGYPAFRRTISRGSSSEASARADKFITVKPTTSPLSGSTRRSTSSPTS